MMRSAAILFLAAAGSAAAASLDFFGDTGVAPPRTRSSSAGRCDAADLDRLEEKGLLHSQDGQDRCLIQRYFPGICGGRFIEVGALDGDRFSNTFAFYSSPDLGWRGVNVEADPVSFQSLSVNRVNDIANVHAAVCSSERTIHYAAGKFKAVGGIWEFSSEEQRERWWPGMTLEDATPVQCTRLQTIVDRAMGAGDQYFDFMSLDIEGAELSALEGLEFDRVGFGVIIIEKQGRGPYGEGMDRAIEELLDRVGYDRIDNKQKTCGFRDNWYINRDFNAIYEGYRANDRRNLRG